MTTDSFSIFDRFEKDQTGIILSILILLIIRNEKSIWGYDIKQHLLNLTEGKLEINNSTVYSILKTFETKYLILKSEMVERRRYYMLTEKGKKDLIIILNDWEHKTNLTINTLKKLGYSFNNKFEEIF